MHELKEDPRPVNIFGITETFLTSNDQDVRIKIHGYDQPERRYRSGKRGGHCCFDSVEQCSSSKPRMQLYIITID